MVRRTDDRASATDDDRADVGVEPAGANELPPPVAEAHNLLVLAGHDETGPGCTRLLDAQAPPGRALVLVSFVETPDQRLEALAGVSNGKRDIDLICMGDGMRSSAASTTTVPSPLGEVTMTTITDPTDLFRLGVHASRVLDAAPGRPTLCLHSLSALVGLVDLQRVFRFLHVLSRRVQSVDGRAHYHLDPDVVDDRAFATLRPLFDAVVRFDGDRWTVE